MCGIAGFLRATNDLPAIEMEALARRMADRLRHRGPDAGGAWVDAEAGIALGHRRLSILDLSIEGSQPMRSHCGRFVISFNGEIYNHLELRSQLEVESDPPRFRGHSDTEVLLSAVSRWGLETALRRANGMFAIALWDTRKRTLLLARDRMGEKPLYFGWVGRTFVFASELKALHALAEFRPEIDRDALATFMRLSYVPSPHSIYVGIRKLAPGTFAEVSTRAPGSLAVRTFWSAHEAALRGVAEPLRGGANDAIEHVDALLRDSIRLRMKADVPVGAFLSGGADSSLVVALMQAQGTRSTRTFTIGFDAASYDESKHARQIAQHLGTDHTELCLTAGEALEVVPRLPAMYDEPLADSSQIPTFLVSQLARRQVTVALSGDGGDELFGGYISYRKAQQLWRLIGSLPRALRRMVATPLRSLRLVPGLDHGLVVRARKVAVVLGARSPTEEMVRQAASHLDAAGVVPRADGHLSAGELLKTCLPPVEQLMLADQLAYLPDDVLAKVDRASMAVSLEVRVPLLDYRLVELAWRLPVELKLRGSIGKWSTRELLYTYVPRELADRRKQGFAIPLADWLRGPLRGWADDLLSEQTLRAQGYLAPEPLTSELARLRVGDDGGEHLLWNALVFQSWLQACHVTPGV